MCHLFMARLISNKNKNMPRYPRIALRTLSETGCIQMSEAFDKNIILPFQAVFSFSNVLYLKGEEIEHSCIVCFYVLFLTEDGNIDHVILHPSGALFRRGQKFPAAVEDIYDLFKSHQDVPKTVIKRIEDYLTRGRVPFRFLGVTRIPQSKGGVRFSYVFQEMSDAGEDSSNDPEKDKIAEHENFVAYTEGELPPFFACSPGFFISHKSKDASEEDQVKAALNKAEIAYWIDSVHMPHGVHWQLSVDGILPYCKGAVFICTERLRKEPGSVIPESKLAGVLNKRAPFKIALLFYTEHPFDIEGIPEDSLGVRSFFAQNDPLLNELIEFLKS